MSDDCNALHPDGIHRCEEEAFHRGPHVFYVTMFEKVTWEVDK